MKRVCVFCGSSTGADPAFAGAATALGRLLAARGLGLVYGGGSVGLMGRIADEMLAAGGEVIGVIPQSLYDREVAHLGLADLRVVASMHERKQAMFDHADAFVALPGGFGTLEEFCEVLTWSQLGYHGKPLGLLNVSGYFDLFLAFLDHAVSQRLIKPQHRALVRTAPEPGPLLALLAAQEPTAPPAPKWEERV